MKNKLLIYLFCFILILIYIFLHPSKEVMTCNADLKCTITHTYIGFIDIKTSINLDKNSQIIPKGNVRSCSRIRLNSASRTCSHVIHLQVSNQKGKLIRPFISYYMNYNSTFEDKSLDIMQYEIDQFYKYLNNPNNKFSIETTSGNFLLLYTIIGTVFAFVMYYVFNFIENILKQIIKFFSKK